MSSIGRILNLPRTSYQWGEFKDEYGNKWNVRNDSFEDDKQAGDEVAYRLDFSDPKRSPQIVPADDD